MSRALSRVDGLMEMEMRPLDRRSEKSETVPTKGAAEELHGVDFSSLRGR